MSLGKEKSRVRKFQADLGWKKPLVVAAILLLAIVQFVAAQNLGNAPQFNVAVQGQTGAQPEGSFLNFINWIGNVIAPVGAGAGRCLVRSCRGSRAAALGGGCSRLPHCWPSQVSRV